MLGTDEQAQYLPLLYDRHHRAVGRNQIIEYRKIW